MREIKAVNITPGDFAPFGTYYSMTEPEGYPLQGEIHKFYPDRISGTCMAVWDFPQSPCERMIALSKWLNITPQPGKAL